MSHIAAITNRKAAEQQTYNQRMQYTEPPVPVTLAKGAVVMSFGTPLTMSNVKQTLDQFTKVAHTKNYFADVPTTPEERRMACAAKTMEEANRYLMLAARSIETPPAVETCPDLPAALLMRCRAQACALTHVMALGHTGYDFTRDLLDGGYQPQWLQSLFSFGEILDLNLPSAYTMTYAVELGEQFLNMVARGRVINGDDVRGLEVPRTGDPEELTLFTETAIGSPPLRWSEAFTQYLEQTDSMSNFIEMVASLLYDTSMTIDLPLSIVDGDMLQGRRMQLLRTYVQQRMLRARHLSTAKGVESRQRAIVHLPYSTALIRLRYDNMILRDAVATIAAELHVQCNVNWVYPNVLFTWLQQQPSVRMTLHFEDTKYAAPFECSTIQIGPQGEHLTLDAAAVAATLDQALFKQIVFRRLRQELTRPIEQAALSLEWSTGQTMSIITRIASWILKLASTTFKRYTLARIMGHPTQLWTLLRTLYRAQIEPDKGPRYASRFPVVPNRCLPVVMWEDRDVWHKQKPAPHAHLQRHDPQHPPASWRYYADLNDFGLPKHWEGAFPERELHSALDWIWRVQGHDNMLTERRTPPPADGGSTCSPENRVTGHTGAPPEVLQGGSARAPPAWPGVRRFVNRPILATDMLTRGGPLAQVVGKAALHGELALTNDDIAIRNETYVPRRLRTEEVDIGALADVPEPVRGYYGVALYADLRDRAEPTTGVVEATQGRRRVAPAFGAVNIFRGALAAATRTTAPEGPDTTPASSTTPLTTLQTSPAAPAAGPSADDPWQRYSVQIQRAATVPARLHALTDEKAGLDASKSRPEFRAIVRATDVWTKPSHPRTGELLPVTSSSVTYERDDDVHAVMLMAADLPEDFARSARSRDPNSARIDQHLGVSHVPDPRRERRGLTVLSTAIMATALRGQALVPNLTEFLVALFGMPQEQARPEDPETVPGLSVVDALFLRDPKLRRFFASADALRAVVMREGMILFNLGTLLCRTIDFLQDFRRPEIMSRYDWPTRLAFDELGQPPAPNAVHQVAPFHFGNITVHPIPTELCAEFPEEGPQLPATVQPWSPPPREQWIRTPEGTVKPFAKAVIYLRRADNTEDPRAVALQHHEIVQNLLGLRGEPGTAPLSTYGHYIGPHALVTKLGRSPDLDETRRFYAAAGVDYDSLSSSRPLPARPDVYGIFPLTDDGVSMQYATAFFVAMGANLHASDPTSFEALHPTISRLVQETCCMGPGGSQPAFMSASEEPRTTTMSDGAYFVSTELQSQLASLDLQAPSTAQLAACIRAGILHGTQFWRSIRFHRCLRGEEPSLANLWAVPTPKAFTIGEADGHPRLYVDESTLREHVASFGLDVFHTWLSAHHALTHSTDSNDLRDPLRRRFVEALLRSRAHSTTSGHTAWETLEAWLRTVFGDYTLRITVAGPLEYDAVTNSVTESVDIATTFQTADPLTYWRDESPKRKGDVFLRYDAGLHWDERTRFRHWNSVNNKRVWVALPPRPGGGPSGGRPPGPPGGGGSGGRDGAGGKRKGDGGKGKGDGAASTSTSSSASVSFPSANSSATTSSKKPRTRMGRKKLRRLEAASARATRGDASTVAATTETVTLSTAPGTTTAPSESAAADGTASASSEYETAASDISEGDNGEPVRIARAAFAPGSGLSDTIKRYLHTMVYNEFRYVVFLKTAYTWMDHHAVPPLQFLAGCGEREERGRTRGAWHDRDFVAEVDNTDWGQFKASHEFVINRMTSLASYIMRTTARWARGNKSDEAAAAMEIHRQATFYLTVVSNACGWTTRDTLRANAVPPLDPRAMHPDLPKETALTVPDTVTWYTRLTGVNRDVFDSTVSELAKFVNDFNNISQSFELPCDKRRPLHVPIEDHAAVNVIYANRTTLDDDRRFNDLRHDARRSKHINSNLRQLRVEAATRVAEAKGITLEAADASLASIDVDGTLRMLVTVAAFEKPYFHMRFGEGPRKQRTVLQKSGVGAFGKHRDTPLVMSAWQPSRSRTLAEERRARKRDRRGHDGPGPPTEQEAEVRSISSDGDDGDDAAGQSTSTAVQRALRRKLHVLRRSRGTDAISRQMRVDRNMLTSSTDPHFVFQPAGLPLLSRVMATRTDSTGRPLTEIPSTFMILAQELAKQVLDAVGGDVGEQLAAQVLKTAAARQEQSWMDRLRATRLVVEGRIAALGTNGWAQESKPVQILIDSGAVYLHFWSIAIPSTESATESVDKIRLIRSTDSGAKSVDRLILSID
eukprot:tig00000836_g4713.t1